MNTKALLAELIGTFTLIFIGVGAIAANAIHMRIRDRDRGSHRHHRLDGIATLRQNGLTGFGRGGMRRGHGGARKMMLFGHGGFRAGDFQDAEEGSCGRTDCQNRSASVTGEAT